MVPSSSLTTTSVGTPQDQPVKKRAPSVDAIEELSDFERTKPKAKGKGKKPTNPFLDEEVDDSEYAQLYKYYVALTKHQHSPEVTVQSSQPVMRIELQDKLLRPYYHDLPKLTFCEVIPYPSAAEASPNKDGTMLLFSPLAQTLAHRNEKARFFRAIQFVSHNSFLNPARIAPSQVVKQTSRCLTSASTRQTAVLISTGAIAACNLIMAVQAGSSQSPYTVKNVSIFPLTQEYERSISCIGMAFGVKEFHGPLAGGTLTFSTRTSNFPSSTPTTAPTTPKAKGLFSPIETSSCRNIPYPASLGVDDTVPVYDGRSLNNPGFEFKGADFDRIRSLPLYQNGLADLPPYSVVSIGYTANTFPYKGSNAGSGALALSLNVLWRCQTLVLRSCPLHCLTSSAWVWYLCQLIALEAKQGFMRASTPLFLGRIHVAPPNHLVVASLGGLLATLVSYPNIRDYPSLPLKRYHTMPLLRGLFSGSRLERCLTQNLIGGDRLLPWISLRRFITTAFWNTVNIISPLLIHQYQPTPHAPSSSGHLPRQEGGAQPKQIAFKDLEPYIEPSFAIDKLSKLAFSIWLAWSLLRLQERLSKAMGFMEEHARHKRCYACLPQTTIA
ncbi:hypothetical protein BD779DRAFT_1469092 [Infundibulicybe gibba]|nr:hypothetical protein BD779DRAFT_1469092 [Infundibulicybe gibba]